MDLFAATAGVFFVVIVAAASSLRRGRAEFERVARDGGSALLDTHTMNAAYGALQPVMRACVRLGVSANMVSVASLGLGLVAGVLLGLGHFGVAALVAALASLGDAVDGLVARETGTASPAGEILDAAVDRYTEFFFLGGVAVHYARAPWALVLTLAAIVGSFMVSYASAKAAALRVVVPRGAMRRPERATYLTLGALFVPLTVALTGGRPWWAGELPMLAALGLVAIVGNASAARRLAAIGRAATAARRAEAP